MKTRHLLLPIIMAAVLCAMNSTYSSDVDAGESDELPTGVWNKPTFLSFNHNTNRLMIGGIQAEEIQSLFLWSVSEEEMLWYFDSPRGGFSPRESRRKVAVIEIGELPNGKRLRWPVGKEFSRIPKDGELIFLNITYIRDRLIALGPVKSSETFYLKHQDGKWISVELEDKANRAAFDSRREFWERLKTLEEMNNQEE